MLEDKDKDKVVLSLIEEVKSLKAEIVSIQKPAWKTKCTFSYSGELSNTINLHVVSDIKVLIQMIGFIDAKYDEYDKGISILKIKRSVVENPELEFTYMGHTYQDWIHDIQARMEMLSVSSKQKQLAMLEERLNKLVSPELKNQLELNSLMEEIKKMRK